MKHLLILIAVLPLISCVTYEDGFGGKLVSWGGSSTAEMPSGGRITHSHTRSFQHLNQTAATIGLGVVGAIQNASDNALTATQGAQQVAREANARVPTIVPAQAVKPDTTVFPQVIPPSAPAIPK